MEWNGGNPFSQGLAKVIGIVFNSSRLLLRQQRQLKEFFNIRNNSLKMTKQTRSRQSSEAGINFSAFFFYGFLLPCLL